MLTSGIRVAVTDWLHGADDLGKAEVMVTLAGWRAFVGAEAELGFRKGHAATTLLSILSCSHHFYAKLLMI
jgi:hypothetical protein